MVMQKPSSTINTGPAVQLGTTDSVTVAKDVTLVSTQGVAITGYGADKTANIYGAVVSTTFYGAVLGMDPGAEGHTVTVGKTGHLSGFGVSGGGLSVSGYDNTVTNHGHIEGSQWGISFYAKNETTHSTIVNTGVIRGAYSGIFRADMGTTETLVLKNSGLIDSDTVAYGYQYAGHLAKDLITNTGRMIGDIRMDGGDDKYDGRKGRVDGDVSGGDGRDQLLGGKEANVFHGDGGADKLAGGLGADQLYGGTEADQFIYKTLKDSSVKPSGRDTIYDFNQLETDRINLQAIDANIKAHGNQKFNFIDDHSFHGKAGELRFTHVDGQTLIQGDVNGDRKADFSILLATEVDLGKGDFIL